ncbi:T-cell differentiation antigen CD6 [Ahaetulla prasina]|uniref:T-cell differentiation antigen CD6 n=1 Tax=Ahaetulla prasina TaxID=499056 RepID=UPI0026470FCD|nr:T-cell differentiation antigen CD6 [Ahaetulla prasina]
MDLVEVLVMALSLMAVRKVQSKPSEPHALRNTSSSTTTAEAEIQKLRLMDGGSNCSGRVELEVMGIWGTVCGDNWDLANAEVVCRQLGCGSASQALRGSHFQNGTGPIHEVKCFGNKLYLWDCLSKRSHDCGHKAAGVICLGSPSIQTPIDTTEKETVTSVSHLPTPTFTTPEDLKATSPDRNLQMTCIILGFLLFLSIVIIIILLLKRQKKNVSVPVLMNHTVQKLTTGGDVSLSLHKTEDVSPSAAHEDSDSDYEDYDFSKKPPVPLSNFYDVSPSAAHEDSDSDYEDYDFSKKPPVPLSNFYATGDQVSLPHNFPKLTMRQETKRPKDYRQQDTLRHWSSPNFPKLTMRQETKRPKDYRQQDPMDSDSTSSEDADWYENIHKPQQHMAQQGDEPSFAGLTVFAKLWSNGLIGSENDSSDSSEHHNM